MCQTDDHFISYLYCYCFTGFIKTQGELYCKVRHKRIIVRTSSSRFLSLTSLTLVLYFQDFFSNAFFRRTLSLFKLTQPKALLEEY